MRYSLYRTELDNSNLFELYLKNQEGDVMKYRFETQDIMFSNVPNATRWYGKLSVCEDDYYLYPISDNGISVGTYEIIQLHEKFIKIRFNSGTIEGEWYIRYLFEIDGEVEYLFWKPTPEGFVCPMQHVEISKLMENPSKEIEIQQAYATELIIKEHEFSGPCMASGIVTGMDRNTTLFTDEFLEKFTKKLQDKMDDLVVDIDHELSTVMKRDIPTDAEKELVNVGKITEIKLNKNKKINYIWCKGQTNYMLPRHAGLSMTLRTKVVWDNDLKIYVAVDGDPIGISITDKIRPACSVCWVK